MDVLTFKKEDLPIECRLPADMIGALGINPRQSFDPAKLETLAAKIKAHGVLENLVVRPAIIGENAVHMYELLAGERRYRAGLMVGLTEFPCKIVDVDDVEAIDIALTENVDREPLTPIEEARGFKALSEKGQTQAEIGRRYGKAQATIANMIRLLDLPKSVQNFIDAGRLSISHGKALLRWREDAKLVEALAEIIVDKKYTIEEIEDPGFTHWPAVVQGLEARGIGKAPELPRRERATREPVAVPQDAPGRSAPLPNNGVSGAEKKSHAPERNDRAGEAPAVSEPSRAAAGGDVDASAAAVDRAASSPAVVSSQTAEVSVEDGVAIENARALLSGTPEGRSVLYSNMLRYWSEEDIRSFAEGILRRGNSPHEVSGRALEFAAGLLPEDFPASYRLAVDRSVNWLKSKCSDNSAKNTARFTVEAEADGTFGVHDQAKGDERVGGEWMREGAAQRKADALKAEAAPPPADDEDDEDGFDGVVIQVDRTWIDQLSAANSGPAIVSGKALPNVKGVRFSNGKLYCPVSLSRSSTPPMLPCEVEAYEMVEPDFSIAGSEPVRFTAVRDAGFVGVHVRMADHMLELSGPAVRFRLEEE